MNAIEPTTYQRRCMAVPETVSLACLGGRGGGKTRGAELIALRHVTQYGVAARVLIVRRSFPALREIEQRLVELFSAALPGSRYSYSDHVLRCPSGALVELGHLEGETDFARYVGRETTLLLVDEVTLWPNLRAINLLRSNLRSPAGVPVRTIICGNPGGPGHAAVSSRFIATRSPWIPFELEPGDWWVLAPSTLDDNPHVPTSYETQLRAAAGGDEALFSAWRRGSWDAIGGAFFSGLINERTIIRGDDAWRPPNGDDAVISLDPWNDRPAWSTFWATDWGISAPAVALGFAEAEAHVRGPGGIVYPRGSRIALCEVHTARPDDPTRGLEWSVDMLADEIRGGGDRFGISRRGCVDDARGLGADETVVTEFRRCGLNMQRAVKGSRVGGWMKMKAMLHAANVRDPDAPRLVIHERCVYTLETMATLPRDPRRIDDCDTTAADHAADACRMGVLYTIPHFSWEPLLMH